LTNLTRDFFFGSFGSYASTWNSVSAQVPMNDRPGPLHGRFGSLSNSMRNPVMVLSVGFARMSVENLVGA
jgi:hypothetical protein